MSLPHSLCFCAWNLESSTTQPLHLPNVLYLLHSLWYHSWKLNHSTTSSPNYSLSLLPPSLISFLWDQPLNHFISQNLVFLPHSLCFHSWNLESSTTQPLHLPPVVYPLHSLWHYSGMLNHSTTSSPYYSLSLLPLSLNPTTLSHSIITLIMLNHSTTKIEKKIVGQIIKCRLNQSTIITWIVNVTYEHMNCRFRGLTLFLVLTT